MAEKSKKEVLSELYAIRAAMSLVSKKTEVTEREEDCLKEHNKKLAKSNSEIREHERRSLEEAEKQYGIATRLQEIEAEERQLSDKIESEKREINWDKKDTTEKVEKYLHEKLRASGVWKFFGISFLIGTAVACVFGALLGRLLNLIFGLSEGPSMGISMGACFGMPVLLTFIYPFIRDGKVQREKKRMLDEGQKKISEHEKIISEAEAEIEKKELEKKKYEQMQSKGETYFNNAAIERIRAEEKEYAAGFDSSIEEANRHIQIIRTNIATIAKESQAIVENARKLYPVIDFRDWANVDLIIFYYETGRADSMKEALQQVDRQRQNDTLVEAIGMATEMISKTIQRSVDSLGRSLDNSFRKLSVQLEFQHQRSMEEVSNLGSKLEAQTERLTEEMRLSAEAQARVQETNQAMTKALLEKIEMSSADLADDMDKQLRLVHGITV